MLDDLLVKTGEFEGPLDLLLELIEKRKLHISTISLSEVADDFIEHTKSFEEFPIKDSADFILVASTLLLIKSKSLLPTLDLSTEEQGSIDDLEKRLAEYQKYKELALKLSKMFGNFLYFPQERKNKKIVFSPTTEITLFSLKQALSGAIQNMPEKLVALPKVVVQKIISLEEMIDNLSERIQKSLRTSFRDFSSNATGEGKEKKVNVIVSFLAILELVKRGVVQVSQDNHFEDILIETDNINTPRY